MENKQMIIDNIKVINEELKKIKTNAKTLEDNALKENLLSVNAAIEAARAGTAGVSFAIVANEMGELSKISNSITEDVENKIVKIEKLLNDVVKAVNE